jgi:ABC-type nitrate/sulfonate/bicarbonate transport system substrate-binding protein
MTSGHRVRSRGRRGLLASLALTAVLTAAAGLGCSRAPGPTTSPAASGPEAAGPRELRTVQYGYVGRSFHQLPIIIGDLGGLLAQEGLQLESIQLNSGTLNATAMMQGEIGYADGLATSVRAAIQGMPLRAVVASERNTSYSLVARPEVRTVADLRGGKIGTSRINSGDYHILVDVLKRHGVDATRDVTMLSVGGTDTRLKSLVSGAIDAGLLGPPADFLAERDGMRTLVGPDGLLPYPTGGLATTEQKLATQRDEVKGMVRAYLRALDFIHREQEKTLAIIREYFDLDAESALASYRFLQATVSHDGTPSPEGLRVLIETERDSLGITHEVPPGTGVDLSVLEEVQRELGKR